MRWTRELMVKAAGTVIYMVGSPASLPLVSLLLSV